MTPAEIEKQISFRAMKSEDEPFIFSSWLHSYFASSNFCINLSKTTFYGYHHKIIEHALKESYVLVAYPNTDPDVILGYLVWESTPIVHYLYIKESFRDEGLATYMIHTIASDLSKLTVTHLTDSVCVEHVRKKYDLIYNPYLM